VDIDNLSVQSGRYWIMCLLWDRFKLMLYLDENVPAITRKKCPSETTPRRLGGKDMDERGRSQTRRDPGALTGNPVVSSCGDRALRRSAPDNDNRPDVRAHFSGHRRQKSNFVRASRRLLLCGLLLGSAVGFAATYYQSDLASMLSVSLAYLCAILLWLPRSSNRFCQN
jgi:hypothetical protein